MIWIICCSIATLFILLSVSIAFCLITKNKKTKGERNSVIAVLIVGLVLSSIVLKIPAICVTNPVGMWPIVIYDVLQVFFLGSEYSKLADVLRIIPGWQSIWYGILNSIIYILGPILVAGSLLNIIKGFTANVKLILISCFCKREYYVFSSIKTRTMVLANSIRNSHKKAVIVFASVDDEDKANVKLCDNARQIGAITLKKDITNLHFIKGLSQQKVSAIFLDDDETLNLRKANEYIKSYKEFDKFECYVFSDSSLGEMMLNIFRDDENCKIKIRRINLPKTTIFNDLYANGKVIFDKAIERDGVKYINAIVVGDNYYAEEMARDLAWFCQMPGYEITIDYFALNKKAAEHFITTCPELVDKSDIIKTNQDACYKLNVHECDVFSHEFETDFSKMDTPTFVFVSLGNDSQNFEVIERIAMLSCRKEGGKDAYFKTIIRSNELSNDNKIPFGRRNEVVDINTIGSFKESFNFENVTQLDLEKEAFARHCKYEADKIGLELSELNEKIITAAKSFYRSEYNYYSSMSSVIHTKYKKEFNAFGINDEQPQCENLQKLEHQRWNAYARSVGYVYAEKRNDNAKQHNLLIKFDDLDEDKKKYDEVIITKENLEKLDENYI